MKWKMNEWQCPKSDSTVIWRYAWCRSCEQAVGREGAPSLKQRNSAIIRAPKYTEFSKYQHWCLQLMRKEALLGLSEEILMLT